MITVQEAENIIQANIRDYGAERIAFMNAMGRVLAEPLCCDRDMPACDRVTMDGIALKYADYASGTQSFKITGVQAAGAPPIEITHPGECIEIMTGAALPETLDTVVPYEDIAIKDGWATITIDTINRGKNVHYKGKDRKQSDEVAPAGSVVDASVINVAATIGKDHLLVKKLPRVVIISTGDELVEVNETPAPYQIRRSNNYTIKTMLMEYGIDATLLHLPDDPATMQTQLAECIGKYDVLLLSGGISMGKFDHLPQVLEQLSVRKLFHKVKQRPGKPFWFGVHDAGPIVFAFPGNPVSTFMCTSRYFLPWLRSSLGIPATKPIYAQLDEDVTFPAPLQYFMQVTLRLTDHAVLAATPLQGNGSGDLANLLDTNAFMELPMERSNFIKGEIYRVWPYKKII